MGSSRRSFLKIAGISALGLGIKPVVDLFASPGSEGSYGKEVMPADMIPHPDALVAGRWAMVIDTRILKSARRLRPLIEVCHRVHNVPELEDERHAIDWIWHERFKHAFPDKKHEFVSRRLKYLPFLVLCNHCGNAPCVRVCPTKATFKREDGIVMMDYHRCIGCRFCMAACPYGSRSFNFRDPRPFIEEITREFPARMRGVVEKCNFCAGRLAVGKEPACAEVSKGGIVFGDLEDPGSEVRKLLRDNHTIRRKAALGTEPAVYYIV